MSEGEVEKVIVSVTPRAVKPKGAARRNSTGILDIKTSPSLSSSDDKLLPHYLRASTSSCHDHCKYGKEHVFEPKKRRPKFPRHSIDSGIQREEQSQVKISTLRVGRKITELKVKTISPKDDLLDKPDVIEQEGQKDATIENLEEESCDEYDDITLMAPSPFHGSVPSLEHRSFSEDEISEESDSIYAESKLRMSEGEVEKVIVSVTPRAVKPKGAARRNSTGILDIKTLPSLSSSDDKLLPHYLQASTSSCHDHCKYGKEHVFEPKKRRPKFPRHSIDSGIQREEQSQVKISTLRVGRKITELKVKTISPKDDLLDKPDVIEQEGQKDATIENLEEESCDEYDDITLMAPSPFHGSVPSLEHRSFSEDEISEESDSIKQMTPSPFHESVASLEQKPSGESEGLSERSLSILTLIPRPPSQAGDVEAMGLETPSPVEKNIISHVSTPLTWSEGSSHKSMSVNQVEGLSEESLEAEVVMPSPPVEKTKSADEPKTSTKSLKPKTSLPIRKSIVSAKLTSSGRAAKTSEGGSAVMLKATPPNRQISANNVKQTGMKNLRTFEGTKREVAKLKTSPKTKTEVPDRDEPIKEKKVEVTGKPVVIKERTSVEKTRTSVTPKMTEAKIGSPAKEPLTSISPRGIKKKDSTPIKKIDVPARYSLSLKLNTPVAKSTSAIVSSPRVIKRKGVSFVKRIDVPARPSPSLELRTPTAKLASALESSKSLPLRRSQGNKMIGSRYLSDPAPEKVLKPSRASLSPKTTANVGSRAKSTSYRSPTPFTALESRSKVGKLSRTGEKPRKSQHGSSSKMSSPTDSPSSLSKEEDHEDDKCILNEASELVFKDDETKRKKPVQSPNSLDKQRSRRTAAARADDKQLSPHKLNFRRGKVVSPKSENNGPRKLRFRQPRVFDNSREVLRRSIRKRRGSIGSATDLIAPASSEAPPPVALRHQDVQEKKETQGLFNHVIEETASKLVEIRKSKVKALVGAFETVISLQEGRVTPTR